MKFSGKMCLMIISKVTKNQGFTLSLEDRFFEKPQGVSNGPPPSRFSVKDFVTNTIYVCLLVPDLKLNTKQGTAKERILLF